jgi:hypothetical protein
VGKGVKVNCSKILDMVYENSNGDGQDEDPITLFNQLRIWMHTLICPYCTGEIERYKASREILRDDFLPLSPGLEDSIMALMSAEEIKPEDEEIYAAPGGLSTRGWVIAGIIVLVSLVTSFFGLDFQKLANEAGISLLLPMGIIIGIFLTTYGALFIGSHLKELSERFGL